MKKGLDFSAAKYSGGGDEDVLRLDQPAFDEPFDGRDLEMFNPICANEVFEIEIRPGLDPLSVIKWLEFDGYDFPDFSDAEDYEYPLQWLQTYEFVPSDGNVMRLALLRQGDQDWHIVGIPSSEDITIGLRAVEDSHQPPTRYFSHRVVGEYSNLVDGPGPVSWETSGAILDLGDYWIEAFGGDFAPNDVIIEKPTDVPAAFVDWLVRTPAASVFILKNVKCGWKDSRLAARYKRAITNIDLVDSGITIFNSLTTEELIEVLELLKQQVGAGSNLLKALVDDQHPNAETLVQLLEEAYVEEEISPHQALEQIKVLFEGI